MIHVSIREGRGYKRIPNGPFPITLAQLEEARETFRKEQLTAANNLFAGVRQAPATTAREILYKVAPQLDSFDRLMLSYAVTNKNPIRTEEA